MGLTDIRPLRRWFDGYVKTFYSDDVDIQAHVLLKESHTARVCDRMLELSDSLEMSGEKRTLAEIVALFHDVGRFQQYTQYRTFNDFRSEDHACMAVRILQENGVLTHLPEAQQELVQKAVRYHNGREVPADSSETLQYARMIRDADKVDILTMITSDDELFRMLPSPEYGGKDHVSDGMAEYIMQGNVARFEHIRTVSDLMLFRMSWVLDMNFPWTFHQVRKQRFLEKMSAKLTQNDSVNNVLEYLSAYRDERALAQTGK